eukprot:COSAG06_NODE_2570_length_6648_cov_1.782257_2_plen_142_part_00
MLRGVHGVAWRAQSTGSTELRTDGSFREWTIFNQGPAGAGKYGLVDDVWMAARVGSSAKMLRTHPPGYAGSAAAVDALTFSGTYPVTRLNVTDASLGAKMSVYGYSTLKPTDLKVRFINMDGTVLYYDDTKQQQQQQQQQQ